PRRQARARPRAWGRRRSPVVALDRRANAPASEASRTSARVPPRTRLRQAWCGSRSRVPPARCDRPREGFEPRDQKRPARTEALRPRSPRAVPLDAQARGRARRANTDERTRSRGPSKEVVTQTILALKNSLISNGVRLR